MLQKAGGKKAGQFVIYQKSARNASPEHLEYKPRGLMTEINVCQTIRQKIHAVFYGMKCSK